MIFHSYVSSPEGTFFYPQKMDMWQWVSSGPGCYTYIYKISTDHLGGLTMTYVPKNDMVTWLHFGNVFQWKRWSNQLKCSGFRDAREDAHQRFSLHFRPVTCPKKSYENPMGFTILLTTHGTLVSSTSWMESSCAFKFWASRLRCFSIFLTDSDRVHHGKTAGKATAGNKIGHHLWCQQWQR